MESFDQVRPSRAEATSLQAQVQCVERELQLRRNVYHRAVNGGSMKQENADREIASMTAVLATVRAARQVEIAAEKQAQYAEECRVQAALAASGAEHDELRAYNTAGDRPASPGDGDDSLR